MTKPAENYKEVLKKAAPEGTDKIFEFEDNGQDFLYWCVDREGNVLAAIPFQTGVWKDSVVAPHVMELALPGDQMVYTFKDGQRCSLKHLIKNIITV